jgi:hypothetical protein
MTCCQCNSACFPASALLLSSWHPRSCCCLLYHPIRALLKKLCLMRARFGGWWLTMVALARPRVARAREGFAGTAASPLTRSSGTHVACRRITAEATDDKDSVKYATIQSRNETPLWAAPPMNKVTPLADKDHDENGGENGRENEERDENEDEEEVGRNLAEKLLVELPERVKLAMGVVKRAYHRGVCASPPALDP